MHAPAQPFRYDATGKFDLNYFTSGDGGLWCTVSAYGLTHTIGPYNTEIACIRAAKAQVALLINHGKKKVSRGDQVVPLW